jgi:hypothetical protein
MSFMIDGKQYIVVAGGPPAQAGATGRGGGGGGGRGAAPGPVRPSVLLALTLDGTGKLP